MHIREREGAEGETRTSTRAVIPREACFSRSLTCGGCVVLALLDVAVELLIVVCGLVPEEGYLHYEE